MKDLGKSKISKGTRRGVYSGRVGSLCCPFARSEFKGCFTTKPPLATTHLRGGLK